MVFGVMLRWLCICDALLMYCERRTRVTLRTAAATGCPSNSQAARKAMLPEKIRPVGNHSAVCAD